MCCATRWSSVRSLKFVLYLCNLDRKILSLNGSCRLSLDGVAFLVLYIVFGVYLFWNGSVDNNSLSVITSFFNLWGGVGCETVTLWYGTGGMTGENVTFWACTGREICGRVVVGVSDRRTIVGFKVSRSRSSYVFTSVFWFFRHIQVMVQPMVWFSEW